MNKLLTLFTIFIAWQSVAIAEGVDVSAIQNATTLESATAAFQSALNALPTTGVDATIINERKDSARKVIAEAQKSMTEATAGNAQQNAQQGQEQQPTQSADGESDDDGSTPDTSETTKRELTDAERAAHEKRISDLQDNADKLKENQQSTANKALTGAAIGTMGGGLMMALQGSAEQGADADAESDMRMFMNTFRCDYGAGKNVMGGDANVELPGMNVLTPLFTEYVTLADSVKASKEALGLSAGIESELILDAANMGLYDNKSLGITGGHYASQYRALMDANSTDAQELADAAKKSKDIKTAGIAMTAVGALGSMVGNALINKDAPKNTANDINKDYENNLNQIQADMEKRCKQQLGKLWQNGSCVDDPAYLAEVGRKECIEKGVDFVWQKNQCITNPAKTACENKKDGSVWRDGVCVPPTPVTPSGPQDGDDCTSSQLAHVTKASYRKSGDILVCRPDECEHGYRVDANNSVCEPDPEVECEILGGRWRVLATTGKYYCEYITPTLPDNLTNVNAGKYGVQLASYDKNYNSAQDLARLMQYSGAKVEVFGTSHKVQINGLDSEADARKLIENLQNNKDLCNSGYIGESFLVIKDGVMIQDGEVALTKCRA